MTGLRLIPLECGWLKTELGTVMEGGDGPARLPIASWLVVHPSGRTLVFDTGMHRHLTLSHHDGYTSRMIWGRPQPETIRDYAVQIPDADDWKTVCDITGNYQRLRRHLLPEGTVTGSLRILVTRTNGLDHARILEVCID